MFVSTCANLAPTFRPPFQFPLAAAAPGPASAPAKFLLHAYYCPSPTQYLATPWAAHHPLRESSVLTAAFPCYCLGSFLQGSHHRVGGPSLRHAPRSPQSILVRRRPTLCLRPSGCCPSGLCPSRSFLSV